MCHKKAVVALVMVVVLASMIGVGAFQAQAAEQPITQGAFVILFTSLLGYQREVPFLSYVYRDLRVYVEVLQKNGIIPPGLAAGIIGDRQAPLTAGTLAVLLAKALRLPIADLIPDPTPDQYIDYVRALQGAEIPIPSDPTVEMTRSEMAETVNSPNVLSEIVGIYKVPGSPIS